MSIATTTAVRPSVSRQTSTRKANGKATSLCLRFTGPVSRSLTAIFRPSGRGNSHPSLGAPGQSAHGLEYGHDGVPHLLRHRPLIAITGAANQPLINVNPDFETVADVTSRLEHDLAGMFDLFGITFFKENSIVDQHARDDPGVAQLHRRPSQHFCAAALELKIAERALVWTGRDVERPAV